jgi:hypothetical protein
MALWGDRRWITDFNKPKAFWAQNYIVLKTVLVRLYQSEIGLVRKVMMSLLTKLEQLLNLIALDS